MCRSVCVADAHNSPADSSQPPTQPVWRHGIRSAFGGRYAQQKLLEDLRTVIVGCARGAGGFYDLGGRVVRPEVKIVGKPQFEELANVSELGILVADFVDAFGWIGFA